MRRLATVSRARCVRAGIVSHWRHHAAHWAHRTHGAQLRDQGRQLIALHVASVGRHRHLVLRLRMLLSRRWRRRRLPVVACVLLVWIHVDSVGVVCLLLRAGIVLDAVGRI